MVATKTITAGEKLLFDNEMTLKYIESYFKSLSWVKSRLWIKKNLGKAHVREGGMCYQKK